LLTFGSALGAFAAAADFTDLTNNVIGASNPLIAAFYPNNELITPTASSPSDLTDLSGNVAAFKATWVEDLSLDPNTGLPLLDNPVSTRIVLYDLYDGTPATTDGDFGIPIE